MRTSSLAISRLCFPPLARLVKDVQDFAFFEREFVGVGSRSGIYTQNSVKKLPRRTKHIHGNNASAFHCAFGLSAAMFCERASSGPALPLPARPLSGRPIPVRPLSRLSSATLFTRPDAVADFGSDVILVIVPRPPDFCGGVYNAQSPPVTLGFCWSGNRGGPEPREALTSPLVDPPPPPWRCDNANASPLF